MMATSYADLTLADIRKELKKRGAKTTGRKAECIDRLEHYDRNKNFQLLEDDREQPDFKLNLPAMQLYKDVNTAAEERVSDAPMAWISPVCDEPDIYLIRLRIICEKSGRNVFYQVFLWETPGKDPSETMFEYLQFKNAPILPFERDLNKKQVAIVKNDPTGNTFDISLLFVCIQWGSYLMAKKSDVRWQEGGDSLESAITSLKNKRNKLMHPQSKFTAQEFFRETEEIRRLLEFILTAAGNRYGIPRRLIDQLVKNTHKQINSARDDPLMPQSLIDYKKQILFKEKREFVKRKSIQDLVSLYREWSFLTPLSVMGNVQFQADTVFTEMLLKNDHDGDYLLSYSNLLDGNNQHPNDPIILIEGTAGSGKTTLTKKLLCDWISPDCDIVKLKKYELLIYTECRNANVSSFRDLVMSLMPDVCKIFQGNDMVCLTLDLNLLVVVDGLDELNRASFELLKELVDLKKKSNISLIITTRPERLQTYYNLVNPQHIKTKHIQLSGISQSRRDEFVLKYHEEMTRHDGITHNVKGLLQYLKTNNVYLDVLWRNPYNLALLTILWIKAPHLVNRITTAPELYWHIHKLMTDRLLGRLQNNGSAQHLREFQLKHKIGVFVSCLSKEALVGLKNDDIDLSEASYKRLKDVCLQEGLPVDEAMSTFLNEVRIRTATGWTMRQSFPHKGVQDFLAAYSLWLNLISKNSIINSDKVVEDIMMVLDKHRIPMSENKDIVNYTVAVLSRTPEGESTVTKEFLINLHKPHPVELSKYQNVLCILIGLLYMDGGGVKDNAKVEVLELLQEAGIRDRCAWLDILNSVKCDNAVLTYIAKIPGLMEGIIRIKNDNVFAYTSLMKVIIPSRFYLNLTGDPGEIPCLPELFDVVTQSRAKIIDLEINDDNVEEYAVGLNDANFESVYINVSRKTCTMPYFKELVKNVVKCTSRVKKLALKYQFSYLEPDEYLGDTQWQLLQICHVECYMGLILPKTVLPSSLRVLQVGLPDIESYFNLQHTLVYLPTLEQLDLCLNADIPAFYLEKLPKLKYPSSILIPDISSAMDVNNALWIIHKLEPIRQSWSFRYLVFPRAKLSRPLHNKLLSGLKDIQVDSILSLDAEDSFELFYKLNNKEHWMSF